MYPVKYKGTKAYLLVYCELIHAARNRSLFYYPDIAKIMRLSPAGNYMSKEIGALLGEISQEEVSQGRPMLSGLAISKNATLPGKGFFSLATELRMFTGEGEEEERKFWEETREAVYKTWED